MDSFAAPFVYGRLQDKKLDFTIQSKCANSSKQITIELDSDLNITSVPDGSHPYISLTLMNTDKMTEASIVDIF